MSAKKLEQRVLNVIKRSQLLNPEECVTLAVSGGVDSMVMLDVLANTQRSHRAKLQVVTFDHGFRVESAAEVQFVSDVCRTYNIPCVMQSLNLSDGPNKQERARQARRDALSKTDGLIATAHHASDQAETVLFRMLRGSGLDGLKGMNVRSGRWVKPLLMEFKESIVEYANERNLEWKEDPSNIKSTRGAIRQLWSDLEKVRPNPEKTMASVATMLSRDAACLDELSEQMMFSVLVDNQIDVGQLRTLHPAIQARILRRWLWQNGVDVRSQQIEVLLEWSPSRNGARLQLQSDVFILQRNEAWSLC